MNKPLDLTALLSSVINQQAGSLETEIRKTAADKARDYIRGIFGKERVSDGKGNVTTINGPMLDFVHKSVDKVALSDETHQYIDAYIRENFQRILKEELDIAIRDKARHETRKGAFKHTPEATPD